MLFDNFKSLLSLLSTSDSALEQNAALRDSSYASSVASHIKALTPDLNIRLTSAEVTSVGPTGLLVNDPLNRELKFDWKGAERLQGWIRPLFQGHGNVSSGFSKIHVRRDDATGTVTSIPYGTLADGRRYFVTDTDHGVFYLNEHGRVMGAVPGFSPLGTPTLPDYGTPSSAITFTVGADEYVAIANAADHFIAIYDTATFGLVQSFGTPGTSGLPTASLLSSPVDLAFDPATSTLYVACTAGIAPGGTSAGYIASFDLAGLPGAAPTFLAYTAVHAASGTLPQGEVATPRGLYFDPTLQSLWILNDISVTSSNPYPNGYPLVEVGALKVDAGVGASFLTAHIDGRSESYWLQNHNTKIFLDNDRRKLFVGNIGSVEMFDLETLKHQYSYGYLSTDSYHPHTQPLAPRVPSSFAPAIQESNAVLSDSLVIDGSTRHLLLFADTVNNRFVRLPEDAYRGSNTITFEAGEYDVPVSISGYLVKGTLSSDKVCISFRTSSTGLWQRLSQTDNVPASTYLQFRVSVTPSLSDIVEQKSIKEIVIVGEHA